MTEETNEEEDEQRTTDQCPKCHTRSEDSIYVGGTLAGGMGLRYTCGSCGWRWYVRVRVP